MKGLASFVMRGPSQAVMVTTVLAMLSVPLPLLGIFGAAGIGLVTLRNGAGSGIRIALLATLACGIFMAIAFLNPLPALGFLLLQWMPVIILAQFLRASRSLDFTLQLALGFGLLLIIGQHLLLNDVAGFWQTQLQPLFDQLVANGVMDQSGSQTVLKKLSVWMGGLMAAGLFLQLSCSLFVARWWQALLYNPGGFREEFHRFRLPKTIGVLGVAAMLILSVPTLAQADLIRHLAILLSTILFLGGLAVMHGLLGKIKSSGIWLGLVYFLLIFLLPQVSMVLATIGLLDVWIDFRTRFGRSRPAG